MAVTNGTQDREDPASEVGVLSADSVESNGKLLRECSIQFPSSVIDTRHIQHERVSLSLYGVYREDDWPTFRRE